MAANPDTTARARAANAATLAPIQAAIHAAGLRSSVEGALDSLHTDATYHRSRPSKGREASFNKTVAEVVGALYWAADDLNAEQFRLVLAYCQAMYAYANRLDRALVGIVGSAIGQPSPQG